MPQREDEPTLSQPLKEPYEARKTDLPYWPQSSLSLALSAILVLIPPSEDSFSMTEASIALRRSYAQLFAQAALASVEKEIDEIGLTMHLNAPGAGLPQGHSPLHLQVPLQLDPILALVVLAVYEYCQRGNVTRMRGRINQAATTAMDISLHELGSTTTEASEARRRAWWITVSSLQWRANSTLTNLPDVCGVSFFESPSGGKIAASFHFITSLADSRIIAASCHSRRSSYNHALSYIWRTFRGMYKAKSPLNRAFPHWRQPWALFIKAQQTLFATHQMVQRIERMDETPPPDLGKQIKNLDAVIVAMMTKSDQYLRYTFDEDGEGPVAENLWRISRILVYT